MTSLCSSRLKCRAVLLSACLPLAVGCASARSTGADGAAVERATRRSSSQAASGRLVANSTLDRAKITLTSLPPVATYAWVAPSSAFARVGPADDVAALGNTAQLRESATAILRANGWREADSASADYRLTLVRTEWTSVREESTPDPRNTSTPVPKCDISTSSVTKPCVEPPRRVYPPIRTQVSSTERSVGYAIMRSSDGAARWWSLNQWDEAEVDRFIAKSTLELLLAVDKKP